MEVASQSANLSENSDSSLGNQQPSSLASDSSPENLGEKKEISVLFADICRYSSLAEKLSSEVVANLLNEYFETMMEAIFKYKNQLDNQIESACIDGRVVAIFGSPKSLADHAWWAVVMAKEMYQHLEAFNAQRFTANQEKIKIGIGINSYTKNSSRIGANAKMEFMAIGEGVHLSYRLEGVCKQYGCDIIMSEDTYRCCRDRITVRELDFIRLPGHKKPISIYEFLGFNSDNIPERKQQVLDHYYKGREYYLQRKFGIAMGEFATVMELDSNDKASAIQLARCQHWLKTPPADDWDGSWTV